MKTHEETIREIEDVFEGYGDLERILQAVREVTNETENDND